MRPSEPKSVPTGQAHGHETPPNLRRLRFLAGGIANLGALGIIRAPARSAQFEWKMAYGDPRNSLRDVRFTQMVNAIDRETGGRMKIQTFPGLQLGSPASEQSQLRLGAIQLLLQLNANFSSILPVAQIESIGFAFQSPRQVYAALDGPLGAYLRREFSLKGIYIFPRVIEAGFRQISAMTRPIRSVEDFAGFKIRTAPSPMFVDLFRTLGASPTAVDASDLYTSLQTRVIDGEETPLEFMENLRLFEVQKYVSLTNHSWGGEWLAANGDAWNALPPDIQATVTRNVSRCMLLVRRDLSAFNASIGDKLARQGLIFNTADTTGMRARLGPYYARWKAELGSTPWSLLELTTGKLG